MMKITKHRDYTTSLRVSEVEFEYIVAIMARRANKRGVYAECAIVFFEELKNIYSVQEIADLIEQGEEYLKEEER